MEILLWSWSHIMSQRIKGSPSSGTCTQVILVRESAHRVKHTYYYRRDVLSGSGGRKRIPPELERILSLPTPWTPLVLGFDKVLYTLLDVLFVLGLFAGTFWYVLHNLFFSCKGINLGFSENVSTWLLFHLSTHNGLHNGVWILDKCLFGRWGVGLPGFHWAAEMIKRRTNRM